MTSKEWAEAEIKRDRENAEELKKLRAEAMAKGDRKMFDFCQSGIRELNKGIRAMLEIYSIKDDGCPFAECEEIRCGDMTECYGGRCCR